MWYPPPQHGVVIHSLRNCVLLYQLENKQLKNNKWILVEIESKVGVTRDDGGRKKEDWVKDAKRANDEAQY